jgi:hypothetical protein
MSVPEHSQTRVSRQNRSACSWRLTLAIVAKGHFGLAEANGVFALGDAIELLEFCLVDALHRKVRRRLQRGKQLPRAPLLRLPWCLLAWLGKYSSMALMPMLVGREAMFAVVGVVWEGRAEQREAVLAKRGVHRSFK